MLAYGATIVVAMLPVILNHDLHAFWKDTIVYQADRVSPFSVWGFYGGLGLEQHLVEGAAVALALAVAFVPRGAGVVEVAALGAAVVIALQLAANYWLYSYIVWFFPLVIVAVFGSFPAPARGAVYGAGSSTCSIASARIRTDALITTAFSHGSSFEVSNLIGIRVAIASTASSRLTPITPPRGPVIPTSVM